MRTSFAALEHEHRELLIALLDAPAGLIDERELAATVRRHHTGGLSRAPGELIDRLADHFLRITPLGIGWVHPSWRDLVIDVLRADAAARRRFLEACGVHGAALALSREGGITGERTLPLLLSDADWDRLTDCMARLLRELEDPDLARLLQALGDAVVAELDPSQASEARSLAAYLLDAARRSWDQQRRPLPLFLLEAWYALRESLAEPAPSPALAPTWGALHPGSMLLEAPDRAELARADEWLALAQILMRYDLRMLEALGFGGGADQELLGRLIDVLAETVDEDLSAPARAVLARIEGLAPDHARLAHRALENVPEATRWWAPEDIPAPPSRDPVPAGTVEFTHEDVDRVLEDL